MLTQQDDHLVPDFIREVKEVCETRPHMTDEEKVDYVGYVHESLLGGTNVFHYNFSAKLNGLLQDCGIGMILVGTMVF